MGEKSFGELPVFSSPASLEELARRERLSEFGLDEDGGAEDDDLPKPVLPETEKKSSDLSS